MPRQANGTDVQPANTAAVSGQSINSAAFNTLIADIYTEITNSLDRNGRSAMLANLPMGGNKITGLADPVSAQDAATKNYADNAISAFFSTGDFKLTLKPNADAGWVLCSDGTIGPTGSGANFADPTALNLYTFLWNGFSNAVCPVTGGRGVSAAADWAGLKPLSLTKMLGRYLTIAGQGSGLTFRGAGTTGGSETAILGMAHLPPAGVSVSGSVSTNSTPVSIGQGNLVTITPPGTGSTGYKVFDSLAGVGPVASTGSITSGTTANLGSGTAFSILPPYIAVNVMIKL